MIEAEKCITCNGDLSFDRVSNCQVCRICHPIKPPLKPPISMSLIGLEYCDTEAERIARIDEAARNMGWNPEKYISEENLRRYGKT